MIDTKAIFKVPAGTEMTPKLLAKYIDKHKKLVATRYDKLYSAYVNDYDILHMEKKDDWKPDNRIPVNFAKYITDTMNGFFVGIPIKTTSKDDAVSNFIEYLDRYNGLDDHNAELAKICSVYGKGYEMYYTDEESNIALATLTAREAFFLYDESILERPMYFVRYYKDYEGIEKGSWSDDTYVQHFERKGSYRWTDEPTPHLFDGVPATEFRENSDCMGIYESALPLINHYNKALSEKANDVDYFADAYLKILGARMEGEDSRNIRRNRIINFEGDATGLIVDFLNKPDGDATQEHMLDRMYDLIFSTSMVANISDENFGSSSGIALRYKLQAMNNLAKTKERKFRAGLDRRYKLIFSNPAVSAGGFGVSADDWTAIDYTFTRNYPANVSDEAAIASTLSGIVSKETQLSVLSIVDNPQSELQRIEDEDTNLINADPTMSGLFGGDDGK